MVSFAHSTVMSTNYLKHTCSLQHYTNYVFRNQLHLRLEQYVENSFEDILDS
jgi:hypothetical protein